MKKLICLLAVLMLTTVSYAQDVQNHLKFKGVPIDGTLNEYVSKMKQKGFRYQGTEDGTALLEGDFAGYKKCVIGVSTLKQKDLVSKIAVIFPSCDTWGTLGNNYFSLKEMLTEKYGNPKEVVEEWQSYSQPDNDNEKMYNVKFDKCKYYTIFETTDGDIQLSISHNGVLSCFVVLVYFDRINSNVIRNEAMDDL